MYTCINIKKIEIFQLIQILLKILFLLAYTINDTINEHINAKDYGNKRNVCRHIGGQW